MKRFIASVLTLIMCFAFASCAGEKQVGKFELPADYMLAFEEEFNGEIDESVWYKREFGERKGGYWAPEQVYTQNGNLIIQTEYRDDAEISGYYTGCLTWNTKRSTYGYYEIRARVDNVRGAWSAGWLMPDDIGKMEQKAQDGCELDIFETAVENKIQNAIHFDGYKLGGNHKEVTKVDNLYDGYHVYAMDWKKDSVKFYYDGELLWEITDPDKVAQTAGRFILSTEINGHKGETDRWLWVRCGDLKDKGNALPSKFIVDYVRIYNNGQLEWSEYDNPFLSKS